MKSIKKLIHYLSILIIFSGGVLQASARGSYVPPGQAASSDMTGFTNLRLLGQAGGRLGPLAVRGGYAYVGVGPSLITLDVSDPTNIHRNDFLVAGPVNDIAIEGGYAFLATEAGLQVVDLQDPAAPRLVGSSASFNAVKVAAEAGYAYVLEEILGSSTRRMRVYSVGDPSAPSQVGTISLTDLYPSASDYLYSLHFSSIQVTGSYVYITWGTLYHHVASGSLLVMDVSSPANPLLTGELGMDAVDGMEIMGSTAYLTTSTYQTISPSPPGSLVVVDLADPSQPAQVGKYTADCPVMVPVCPNFGNLAVAGSYAYATSSDGLRVVDISDPANPFLAGKVPASGANIALEAGFVYLSGADGMQIFDLADPIAPAPTGEYHPLFQDAHDAVVRDGHVYLAADDGLHVLNVSAPSDIVQEAYATVSGQKLALKGNILYLANQYGLQVVDVSMPSHPKGLSSLNTGSSDTLIDFTLSGNYAYLEMYDGLYVLDVSDPAHPQQAAHLVSMYNFNHIAVNGGYAYRANIDLQVLDVSDPANPVEVTRYPLKSDSVEELAASGRYLYILQEDSILKQVYLTVLDVQNPAQPVELNSSSPLSGFSGTLTFSGHYAYVSVVLDGLFQSGMLQVIDVSDPDHLQYAGSADLPGGNTVAIGDYVYLATYDAGLYALQFAGSQVHGRVAAWEGSPEAGVVISATSGISVTTSADGSYLLPNLYSGDYVLTPHSQEYAFYPPSCTPSLPPDAICNFTALSLPVTATLQAGVSSRLVYTDTQGQPTILDFPVGAVTQPSTAVLTPTMASSGAGLAFTGHAFELSAQDSQGPILDFAAPVTATISYTDFDVRFVTDESQLILYRWDGGDWVDAAATCTPASAYTRDPSANQISLPICQPGKYALYGPTHAILLPAILMNFH